ncbi:cupin domain-containing protein [Rhodococcus opacus]|uniref:cupin domain-containing protein n=1 Tax=Rhodococcus opacus TaxID=37919 RepID=UPI000A90DC6A
MREFFAHRDGAAPTRTRLVIARAKRKAVVGGREHALRHTLIALTAGTQTSGHHIHGEATVYILNGRVELTAGGTREGGRPGDLRTIAVAQPHRLEAVEDSVVLLTVVKPAPGNAPER